MAIIKTNLATGVTGTLGTAHAHAGNIIQVVHKDADTNGNLVTSSTNSFSDAFTAAITPTVATSKILCVCSFSTKDTRDGDQLNSQYQIVRQISGGSNVTLSSAKSGYSDNENVEVHLRYIDHPAAASIVTGKTFTVMDDHNTTSEITYKLQMKASNTVGAGGCYFTLMEIAT